MLALTALALYTPLQQIDRPLVLVEDGVVASVGSRLEREIPADARLLDFKDGILAPGLVDIHIHGAGGFDVMQPDAQARGRMERFLAARGVTSYFPTTVTAGVSAASIAYAIINFVIGLILYRQLAEPGIITLIVAMFFFGGVQLFFMGMIGEYVLAIYGQVREKPVVFERERVNFGETRPPSGT